MFLYFSLSNVSVELIISNSNCILPRQYNIDCSEYLDSDEYVHDILLSFLHFETESH